MTRTRRFEMSVKKACLIALLAVVGSSAGKGDEVKSATVTATVRPAFVHPCDVYCVYRLASEKPDWGTVFECLTPDAQANAIFELYFACNMRIRDGKVTELLKKSGIEPMAVDQEYRRRYETLRSAKSAAKASSDSDGTRDASLPAANGDSSPTVLPAEFLPASVRPSLDERLYRQVVASLVTDPAEFFVAASKTVTDHAIVPANELGNLYGLTVDGDIACGTTTRQVRHLESRHGADAEWKSESVPLTVHFRRIECEWLIQSVE